MKRTVFAWVCGVSMLLVTVGVCAEEKMAVAPFQNVEDAYQAWTTNAAAKQAALRYIEGQVLATPRVPVSFLNAWQKYVGILQAQGESGRLVAMGEKVSAGLNVEMGYPVLYTIGDIHIAQQKWPEALKARLAILERYRGDMAAATVQQTVYSVVSIYADKMGKAAEAIDFLNKEIGLVPADNKAMTAGHLNSMAGVYFNQLNDRASAEASYRKILEMDTAIPAAMIVDASMRLAQLMQDRADPEGMDRLILGKNKASFPPAYVQQIMASITQIYTTRLGQPEKAIAFLKKELATVPADNKSNIAYILGLTAGVYEGPLHDQASAEACYSTMFSFGASLPPAQFGDAANRLTQILQDKGDADGASRTALEGIRLAGMPAQRLLDTRASVDKLIEGVSILRDKVVAASVPPAVPAAGSVNADAYQADIVRLLVAVDRKEEALQEARAWLNTCSTQSLPQAIELVTYAFKSADGNLSRANSFLRFQKYGPSGEDGKKGTADDVEDELKKIPLMTSAARRAKWERVLPTIAADWQGYKGRATIYFYMDDPVQAFDALRRSFEMCPMNEQALQSVADSITRYVVISTRDVSLAEKMVAFMMYGSLGKDGKAGTQDDVVDPASEIMRQAGLSGGAAKIVARAEDSQGGANVRKAKIQ